MTIQERIREVFAEDQDLTSYTAKFWRCKGAEEEDRMKEFCLWAMSRIQRLEELLTECQEIIG